MTKCKLQCSSRCPLELDEHCNPQSRPPQVRRLLKEMEVSLEVSLVFSFFKQSGDEIVISNRLEFMLIVASVTIS